MIQVTGTDHITLVGSNEEDTVSFYRGPCSVIDRGSNRIAIC